MLRDRNELARHTRRQWLRAGAMGALGLSTAQWLALQARGASGKSSKAKSVLLLVEHGGMSHVDTFDPKPETLSDHRTPFDLAATSVPGVHFTELLGKTAKIFDKIAVVRGMRHPKPVDDHQRGFQYTISGEIPGGPTPMPDMGSAAAYTLGSACRWLPSYVQLPATSEMAFATSSGFLPAGYAPYKATAGDASDPAWRPPGLQPNPSLAAERVETRRSLLSELDKHPALVADRKAAALESFHEQAAGILESDRALRAFDLTNESPATRERYGRGHRGACYLLGRKLIEAGVRFVTIDVRWPYSPESPGGNLNWDHHDHIYASGTCELPGASGAGAGRFGIGHWVMTGSLDHAYSALITDLEERGLLDETLVVLASEFGRTPRINKHQGRDHWPFAYSVVFAGAGVRGGQVLGATDRHGGYVVDGGHAPEDVAATIYDALGVDRGKPLYTSEQRPIFLAHEGKAIADLW